MDKVREKLWFSVGVTRQEFSPAFPLCGSRCGCGERERLVRVGPWVAEVSDLRLIWVSLTLAGVGVW